MDKKFIVVKVSSKECPICQHMSKHDRATFDGFPELQMKEMDLDELIENRSGDIELLVYSAIERHALNPDYTVDTPLYIFLSQEGKYLGHHSGAATIVELREITKDFISGSS